MKLIKPSFEIWEQEPGLKGIYKAIERAGRVCYKSENKITEDSAKPFVDRMDKLGHGAVLEHGTVYLNIPYKDQDSFNTESFKYETNPYSKATEVPPNIVHKKWHLMITTNYRVLIQNNWLDDLKYICKPTEFHEKRITVKFILSRSIAQEYTRHRMFSFAMESQRYCAYNKDKFGNEVTFIIPCWLSSSLIDGNYKWEDQNPLLTAGMSVEEAGYDDSSDLWIKDDNNGYNEYKRHYDNWVETETFMHSLQVAENDYLALINQGWKPQQAREVLPNACKTELVMTGTIEQWKEFFRLRTAADAHPQARELAIPLREEFIKRGYINE